MLITYKTHLLFQDMLLPDDSLVFCNQNKEFLSLIIPEINIYLDFGLLISKLINIVPKIDYITSIWSLPLQ